MGPISNRLNQANCSWAVYSKLSLAQCVHGLCHPAILCQTHLQDRMQLRSMTASLHPSKTAVSIPTTPAKALSLHSLVWSLHQTSVDCRARYDSPDYDCVVKIFGDVDPAWLQENTKKEYDWLCQAWAGGGGHCVEPLGLYQDDKTDWTESFILMRYAL